MPDTVLVVEDDDSLARSIDRNLYARGLGVRSASSVAEALDVLAQERIALVLLDVDLPDGSGWEIAREVRQESDSYTQLIVMSALRPNAQLARALRCTAVLEKPFPMESLVRLIVESLDRQNGHTAGTRRT